MALEGHREGVLQTQTLTTRAYCHAPRGLRKQLIDDQKRANDGTYLYNHADVIQYISGRFAPEAGQKPLYTFSQSLWLYASDI